MNELSEQDIQMILRKRFLSGDESVDEETEAAMTELFKDVRESLAPISQDMRSKTYFLYVRANRGSYEKYR